MVEVGKREQAGEIFFDVFLVFGSTKEEVSQQVAKLPQQNIYAVHQKPTLERMEDYYGEDEGEDYDEEDYDEEDYYGEDQEDDSEYGFEEEAA